MAWAPNYTTVDNLAAYARIGDTADDVQLALAIAAASRAIDRATGRQFGVLSAAAARYYTARWDGRRRQWYAVIDDLMTTTGLLVAYDDDEDGSYGTSITGYSLRPINAAADGRPWTELWVNVDATNQPSSFENGLRVTAKWGWTAIPETIEQSTLLQASRLLKRRDSPFGIAGSADTGSELRLLARVDPDVEAHVKPYRRMWGAV